MIHTDNYSLSGFAHHPINHRGEEKKKEGEEGKNSNPQPASTSSKPSNLAVGTNSLLGIVHGNNVLILENS